MVSGDVVRRSFDYRAPFGRLVSYGNVGQAAAGGDSGLDAGQLLAPNHRLLGFHLGGYFAHPDGPGLVQQAVGALSAAVADGARRVRVHDAFALADAAAAHRAVEGRATTGKVGLRP